MWERKYANMAKGLARHNMLEFGKPGKYICTKCLFDCHSREALVAHKLHCNFRSFLELANASKSKKESNWFK